MLTIAVIVFTLLSLAPALTDGTNPDHIRALFGIGGACGVCCRRGFVRVAVGDSYVEVTDDAIFVRFESFFNMAHPRLRTSWTCGRSVPQPRFRLSLGAGDELSRPHLVFARREDDCDHDGGTGPTVRLFPRTCSSPRLCLRCQISEGPHGGNRERAAPLSRPACLTSFVLLECWRRDPTRGGT